jgi:hypothetical protein
MERISGMSESTEVSRQHRLDGLLRVVVALEVVTYFGAALLHLGMRIPLGLLVLRVPNPIPAASIVETILGLAAAINLGLLLQAPRSMTRITLGIHLFLLVGVALGMAALSRFVGPPPSPDWNIHFVMSTGIAAALTLSLIQLRRDKA